MSFFSKSSKRSNVSKKNICIDTPPLPLLFVKEAVLQSVRVLLLIMTLFVFSGTTSLLSASDAVKESNTPEPLPEASVLQDEIKAAQSTLKEARKYFSEAAAAARAAKGAAGGDAQPKKAARTESAPKKK